ncbi:hypothetical protein [Bartonella sp. HY761]|uniref:hypothetical protein n=1 Tax=Bartonella sp. HY761 TaxID=2979330 RepID=UPI00220D12D8|nr:hypothetical protein [Bartonella sp. HY761]UXN06227.1 hypothetical protein N6A79_13295 [Bartonella sp. HY761]
MNVLRIICLALFLLAFFNLSVQADDFVNHQDMLGRSAEDPVFKTYMEQQRKLYPLRPVPKDAPAWETQDFDTGFNVSMEEYDLFNYSHGEPKSRFSTNDDEKIVLYIEFGDSDSLRTEQRPYKHPLPFGLRFGDTPQIVAQKLNTKPGMQTKSSWLPGVSDEKYSISYRVGNLNVIATYTGEEKLIRLTITLLDRADIRARERQQNVKNYIIDPKASAGLEIYRQRFPTKRWRKLIGLDKGYNEQDIRAVEEQLNIFIDNVKAATQKADAEAIYKAVEILVVNVNDINDRNGLVETLERDELSIFIDKVVAQTGFLIEENEDITSEWRRW